ncbi:MAG: phytanoyl-CoA dioxygenase family protein [Thermomicrobiales bacterium]
MTTTLEAAERRAGQERYRVTVEQYRTIHAKGYLVVPGLVGADDVWELVTHTDDILAGRIPPPGMKQKISGWTMEEIERLFNRTFMPHLDVAIHERFLLHPRILDVLEALIGPDVMAMQTMLFLKPPGSAGQGYHQDAYYIPTKPDTLCGAWLALDRADEENGCLWMTGGTQHEPIYPDVEKIGQNHAPDALAGLTPIDNASHVDENINGLTAIARKYTGQEVPVIVDPGDVVFFQGHILHRSHANRSRNRFRRSFVGHYANARSYTAWYGGNGAQILARGDTHLPFAVPRFGTPCAATLSAEERARQYGQRTLLAQGELMGIEEVDPARNDPTAHDH